MKRITSPVDVRKPVARSQDEPLVGVGLSHLRNRGAHELPASIVGAFADDRQGRVHLETMTLGGGKYALVAAADEAAPGYLCR